MRVYGLKKEQFELIKEYISEVFSEVSDLKVYLFGSRAKGTNHPYSDIDLAFKTKDKNIQNRISSLKEKLEDSNLPYKFDLVPWSEIYKDYLPDIRKHKIPFWSADEQIKSSPWRICPLGHHFVRRHNRNLKTGTIVDRDGHCRKNPSHKDILKSDEIDLISELAFFKQAQRPSSLKNEFEHGDDYDDLIAGWVAYWNDILSPLDKLDPNWVKALIATESSFDPNAIASNKSKKIGQARGLIQITEQTFNILKNEKGELKDHLVILNKKEDLFEPNKNLCAGIRWIFRKKELIKKRTGKGPSWQEVMMEYKGKQKKSVENQKIRKSIEYYWKQLNEN